MRTHELMLSGPVAESDSRAARKFSTFSGAKDRIQEQLGITGKGGYREREAGWGRKILKQTQNRGIRPSHERSRPWCHLK